MNVKATPYTLHGYRFANKGERDYALHLDALKQSGEIRDWAYGAVKFRVGLKISWYEPDFLVINPDWTITMHEYKGHWREDARVKIKAAAHLYPAFKWVAVTRKGGIYNYEWFRGEA